MSLWVRNLRFLQNTNLKPCCGGHRAARDRQGADELSELCQIL